MKLDTVLQVLLVLFAVSVCHQFQHDYYHNLAMQEYHKDFAVPPVDCGPKSKSIKEIGWKEWAVLVLLKDRSNKDCMEYVRKLKESPWPNPLSSVLQVVKMIGLVPFEIVLSAFEHKSLLAGLLSIALVVGVLHAKPQFRKVCTDLKQILKELATEEEPEIQAEKSAVEEIQQLISNSEEEEGRPNNMGI